MTIKNMLPYLIKAKVHLNIPKCLSYDCLQKINLNLNRIMRESAFYVYENKGPNQLSGNHTADERLSFRYIDNTNTLIHESEISNLRPSSMSVQPYPCRSWSITSNTGFLETRLKYLSFLSSKISDDCLCCGLCQFHQTEAVGVDI